MRKNPIIAPKGSDKPERKDNLNAFLRLQVAKKIGTDTAIPSGMLCMAMAKAIG